MRRSVLSLDFRMKDFHMELELSWARKYILCWLWWWEDRARASGGARPGDLLPSFCRTAGNCSLQSALAAVTGCREEPRQLQPELQSACSGLQPRAVGSRYQWGHHQSINCVSGPGGRRGGGPNTRTSSWLSPGLSRNRILAKVIGSNEISQTFLQ